jgi:hypothetical protein
MKDSVIHVYKGNKGGRTVFGDMVTLDSAGNVVPASPGDQYVVGSALSYGSAAQPVFVAMSDVADAEIPSDDDKLMDIYIAGAQLDIDPDVVEQLADNNIPRKDLEKYVEAIRAGLTVKETRIMLNAGVKLEEYLMARNDVDERKGNK